MLLEFWVNLTPLCSQVVLEWVNLTPLCTQVVLEWVNLVSLCTQRCWSESIWYHFALSGTGVSQSDTTLHSGGARVSQSDITFYFLIQCWGIFAPCFIKRLPKRPIPKLPISKPLTERNDLPSKAFFETKQKKIWLYPWFLTAKLHSKRRFTSPNTLWKTYSELCSFSAESYSSESRPCCDPKLPKLLKLPSSGLPNTRKPHLPTPPPSKNS